MRAESYASLLKNYELGNIYIKLEYLKIYIFILFCSSRNFVHNQ